MQALLANATAAVTTRPSSRSRCLKSAATARLCASVVCLSRRSGSRVRDAFFLFDSVIPVRWVGHRVAHEAVRHRLDEVRPVSCTRRFHRSAHHRTDSEHIRAVHGLGCKATGAGDGRRRSRSRSSIGVPDPGSASTRPRPCTGRSLSQTAQSSPDRDAAAYQAISVIAVGDDDVVLRPEHRHDAHSNGLFTDTKGGSQRCTRARPSRPTFPRIGGSAASSETGARGRSIRPIRRHHSVQTTQPR